MGSRNRGSGLVVRGIRGYAGRRARVSQGRDPYGASVRRCVVWWGVVDVEEAMSKTLDELDRSNPMPSDMVFSHDQLYSAYPQLGDVPWYRTPSMEGGGGSYDATRGIRVGSGEGLASGKNGVGGITLHEQQHAVQGIEGFAQGGNRDVGHPRADVERMAREAYEANQAASKRPPTADDLLLAELGINPPDVSKPWDSLTPRQQMDWWEAGRGRAYHHLAGEAEARLVQKRMDLSADERRARPPWLDYDVPEEQQIVRGMSEPMFAMVDTNVGREMKRDLDKLGYFSGALEAAKRLKQAKGTPEQMLAMLQKEGAKKAEIEATGLSKFLEGRPSVTRDEIVKHLEGNRLGLNEATYQGREQSSRGLAFVSEVDAGNGVTRYELRHGRTGEVFFADDNGSNVVVRDSTGKQIAKAEDMGAAEEEIASYLNTSGGRAGPSKWSAHSLDPSNPTYRETVLHLPIQKDL